MKCKKAALFMVIALFLFSNSAFAGKNGWFDCFSEENRDNGRRDYLLGECRDKEENQYRRRSNNGSVIEVFTRCFAYFWRSRKEEQPQKRPPFAGDQYSTQYESIPDQYSEEEVDTSMSPSSYLFHTTEQRRSTSISESVSNPQSKTCDSPADAEKREDESYLPLPELWKELYNFIGNEWQDGNGARCCRVKRKEDELELILRYREIEKKQAALCYSSRFLRERDKLLPSVLKIDGVDPNYHIEVQNDKKLSKEGNTYEEFEKVWTLQSGIIDLETMAIDHFKQLGFRRQVMKGLIETCRRIHQSQGSEVVCVHRHIRPASIVFSGNDGAIPILSGLSFLKLIRMVNVDDQSEAVGYPSIIQTGYFITGLKQLLANQISKDVVIRMYNESKDSPVVDIYDIFFIHLFLLGITKQEYANLLADSCYKNQWWKFKDKKGKEFQIKSLPFALPLCMANFPDNEVDVKLKLFEKLFYEERFNYREFDFGDNEAGFLAKMLLMRTDFLLTLDELLSHPWLE